MDAEDRVKTWTRGVFSLSLVFVAEGFSFPCRYRMFVVLLAHESPRVSHVMDVGL